MVSNAIFSTFLNERGSPMNKRNSVYYYNRLWHSNAEEARVDERVED